MGIDGWWLALDTIGNYFYSVNANFQQFGYISVHLNLLLISGIYSSIFLPLVVKHVYLEVI